MQPDALLNLIHQVQQQQCETQTIEVKSAHLGCPTRLFDTLSSFSNQDEGGILIFGLDEKRQYDVVGVYDAQDLQQKVTEQCKQMDPVVRPLFTLCEVNGKMVVSAEIPGMEISNRPVFYRGVGRIKGSYLRVGESDAPMSEYEIYSYEAFRKRIRDDMRTCDMATGIVFDAEKISFYLSAVKRDRANLSSTVSERELLELMGVTKDKQPTLAGLLCFSVYPQAPYPQLCITAVSVPGSTMGDTGALGERFLANQRITGTIEEMLKGAVDFVVRNERVKTIIDANGNRADKPEYPTRAVREAILNALVHRDYSVHSENVPVRIVMYRDRLEILNSGGLYGNITVNSLGRARPDTRNAILANILEMLRITENRYSGIPTILKDCKDAGLPEPSFSVYRGEFVVTFFNGEIAATGLTRENGMPYIPSLRNEGRNSKQSGSGSTSGKRRKANKNTKRALHTFCEIPRTREELVAFTGFSQYYTMKLIQSMISEGIVRQTIPETPRSRRQQYVSTRQPLPHEET